MIYLWIVAQYEFTFLPLLLDKFQYKSELVLLGIVGFSDFIAYVTSALILGFFKGKYVLTSFFCLAFLGGTFLAFKDYSQQEAPFKFSFYLAYFSARVGVSGAFNTIYCVHESLFPPLFATSSFGYCQVIATAVTVCCAYMADRVNLNLAMGLYALLAMLASLLSLFLKHTDETDRNKGRKENES